MLTFLICSACAPEKGPPDIAYGQELCQHCKMVIQEPRFAAAFREVNGRVFRFDDIGCMIQFLRQSGREPAEIWVHDYEGGDWLPAEAAFFVCEKRVQTPMGSGIVAFARQSQAAAVSSQVYRWEEIFSVYAPPRREEATMRMPPNRETSAREGG